MAVDHGMLSFIDIDHGQWPAILITNPKQSLFLIPKMENLEAIKESTHIRYIVYFESIFAISHFF